MIPVDANVNVAEQNYLCVEMTATRKHQTPWNYKKKYLLPYIYLNQFACIGYFFMIVASFILQQYFFAKNLEIHWLKWRRHKMTKNHVKYFFGLRRSRNSALFQVEFRWLFRILKKKIPILNIFLYIFLRLGYSFSHHTQATWWQSTTIEYYFSFNCFDGKRMCYS